MLATLLASAAEAPGSGPWWEIAAGIIAIPVAVIGFVYTWALIKKTRLESRKTELEISEREAALAQASSMGDSAKVVELVAEPLSDSRRSQDIIVRFVVLFLATSVWTVVEGAANTLAKLFAGGVALLDGPDALVIVAILIRESATVSYYLVVLGLGGPLFVDLLQYLKYPVPRWLRFLQSPKAWAYITVGGVVLVLQYFAGILD